MGHYSEGTSVSESDVDFEEARRRAFREPIERERRCRTMRASRTEPSGLVLPRG